MSERLSNPRSSFCLKINEVTVISHEDRTVDGRVIGPDEKGVFQTQAFGTIAVDLSLPKRRYPNHGFTQDVKVSGEALKRPAREGSSDNLHHLSAIEGVHTLSAGDKSRHSKQTIGKDPSTGEIRTVEIFI